MGIAPERRSRRRVVCYVLFVSERQCNPSCKRDCTNLCIFHLNMPATSTRASTRLTRGRKEQVSQAPSSVSSSAAVAKNNKTNKAAVATPSGKRNSAQAKSAPAVVGRKRPAEDTEVDARSSGSKSKKKKDTTSSVAGSESPVASHISPEEYALFLKFKESQAKAKTATQLQTEKDAGKLSVHIHTSCCPIRLPHTDIRRRNEEMLRADSEESQGTPVVYASDHSISPRKLTLTFAFVRRTC